MDKTTIKGMLLEKWHDRANRVTILSLAGAIIGLGVGFILITAAAPNETSATAWIGVVVILASVIAGGITMELVTGKARSQAQHMRLDRRLRDKSYTLTVDDILADSEDSAGENK